MRKPLRACMATIVAVGATLCADACTAILVGRKASASGRVIVAHNEDFRSGSFTRYAFLPRRNGALAAFWSEVKTKTGEQPIAHMFFNECGVIVFSNNGGVMSKWAGDTFCLPDEGDFSVLAEGGIGYRLRCETIEKAHTAREGVEIMTGLVKRYGYTERSRLFTIADRDEIWVVQVLHGKRFVARRCPDDCVAVFPNCLTVNRIQPGDIVSDNIAAKGKDFDFISFYQGPRTWKSPYNLHRWQDAYRIVAGVRIEPGNEYPFAVKPACKVSVDDIKRALSSHYEGMPWEVKSRHPENNDRDVQPLCRNSTIESVICAMGETPVSSEMHIATGRPCETPYVAYRPLAGDMPKGAAIGSLALRRLKRHAVPPDETDAVCKTRQADVPLVVGLADRGFGNASVGIYANALYAAGHTPLMIPCTENRQAAARALEKVDVLLLCGGEDVATVRYGEVCMNACMPNLVRDAWEWMLLDEAVKRRLPVVGICRGLQVINVYFGGSLYQDLVTGFSGAIKHSGGKVPTAHPVRFERDSRIGRIVGVPEMTFASWHHQGVKRLAPGFKVAAYAPDGFVEAIEAVNYPAAGVQFHPERTYAETGDDRALALFRAILEWAGASRRNRPPFANHSRSRFRSQHNLAF